jgi:hypothetical protein
MNKGLILFFSTIVGLVGSYIPVLFGDSMWGGWSLFGSFVGGLLGIWLGVVVSRRWG